MQKQIYHDGYRRLIKALRNRRLSLGMTQANAAEKLGISRTWIAKIEQCELSLNLLWFIRLCNLYGLAPIRLLDMLEHGR